MSTQDGLQILAEDQLLRQIVDCFMELDQVSIAVELSASTTVYNMAFPVRRSSQSPAILLQEQNGKHPIARLLRDDTCPQCKG